MTHEFSVGQFVTLETNRLRLVSVGEFEVLNLLPDRQYRIKNVKENYDRVAQECDLRFHRTKDLKKSAPNTIAIAGD
jgi:hypothetical protein